MWWCAVGYGAVVFLPLYTQTQHFYNTITVPQVRLYAVSSLYCICYSMLCSHTHIQKKKTKSYKSTIFLCIDTLSRWSLVLLFRQHFMDRSWHIPNTLHYLSIPITFSKWWQLQHMCAPVCVHWDEWLCAYNSTHFLDIWLAKLFELYSVTARIKITHQHCS